MKHWSDFHHSVQNREEGHSAAQRHKASTIEKKVEKKRQTF